ncbi:MAG: glycosyltransferase family 2 protein [Planctomycetes bacterium]|nr:glycosyltransferase family 2 protein [Planctomycetota bacterium]
MIFLLLPAFNEEASLPVLLPKLDKFLKEENTGFQIVVCNDGSRDRTLELLEEYKKTMPIVVLNHVINRGLGETARDLFEYAAWNSKEGDVIVRMDCDDTHEPQFIKTMIQKLSEGYDVVIASRFQPGGGQHGVSGYRAFISSCANLFMKCMFPLKGIREYSCGYRAYTARIIKNAVEAYGNNFIQLKGLGFTGTLEKLVKLKMIGAKFSEVPFVLRYDQKQSASKMVSSITTIGYFVMAFIYHWPFGGWRRSYKHLARKYNEAHAPSEGTTGSAVVSVDTE